MMQKGFKGFLGVSLSAILMGSLAVGCSSSQTNNASNAPATTGTNAPAANAKPYAGQTLTFVMANHPWSDAIKPLLADFEAKTGIKVVTQNYGEDQLSQKLTVSLTASTSSPDVFMYRPLQEGKLYYKNGWLQPLDTYVSKDPSWNWGDFNKGSVGTVTVDNKISGVPIITEQEILYYRKDLFQKAGLQPPKTIDELVSDAKKLNDPANGVYGFVSRGQRSPAVTQVSSFLYSYGGDWDKAGKATVNTPEAIQAFTTYGNLLKNYGPPGVLNMSWPQAMGIFAEGKAAMLTDADSIYSNALDPKKSTVADKVGFAVFPAGPAGSKPYNVTSWGLTINSKSEHKDAAWEFVKWATSEEIVMKTQQKGNPGARDSVWNSPQGSTGFPAELAPIIKQSAAIGVNHDRPVVVGVGPARDIVGNIVTEAISGHDVKAAADKAETDYQALLDKENGK